MKSKAYIDGYMAYYDNKVLEDNPFAVSTTDYNEWNAGWYDGRWDD